jgi:hypothetical protein
MEIGVWLDVEWQAIDVDHSERLKPFQIDHGHRSTQARNAAYDGYE